LSKISGKSGKTLDREPTKSKDGEMDLEFAILLFRKPLYYSQRSNQAESGQGSRSGNEATGKRGS